GDERRPVRTRERDAEACERDEEERGRDVAAPRGAGCDRCENVEVRERDRVARATALDQHVREQEQRQQEQRQQEKRVPERHLPPAHTASSCTTPRPPPPDTAALIRPPESVTFDERLPTRAGAGGLAVRKPRALYAATRRSSLRQRTDTERPSLTRTVFTRRTVAFPGG